MPGNAQSRASRRQFDFEIFHRRAGLVQKAHGSLPTVLFVDDFENDDVDALLQGHLSLVRIEHQRSRFAERVDIHTVKIDSALIVTGHRHDYVGSLRIALDVGDHVTGYMRSEEHTSELQSPYVISYAVFCL